MDVPEGTLEEIREERSRGRLREEPRGMLGKVAGVCGEERRVRKGRGHISKNHAC